MDSATLQSWLNALSTVAAAVSAIAAWRALKLSHESNVFQREQGRPYFSFEETRMERKPLPTSTSTGGPAELDPNVALAKGLFKNYGARPATEIASSIFIIPTDDSSPPMESPSSLADDFPPGAEWMAQLGEQTINAPSHPGYFFVLGVSYNDPLTKRNYRQLFFMRWPGVKNGVVHGDIIAATREERDRLIHKHRRLLSNYV
ncbi:hypothetical protein RQP54_11310 [Curvibacter sp. APW13]|uniref:hypothetical protein n=1 Tax=Curvibacter sp. APW13 TaxID=3077236 RepID=UPI0028DE8A1F|nr:hypothetical protein [Curvibacter sp. APW13]MDT8991449.1 hypothetical protein [Curvibacter sp. APW13]